MRHFHIMQMNELRAAGWCATAVLLMVGLGTPTAWGNQPTLDELLDLDASRPADTAKPDDEDRAQGDASLPVDPNVQRLLDGEEVADAFAEAVKQMDAVSLRLGQSLDAGLDTQRMQESILAKLDQVIAAARQQQSQSSSNSSSGGEGQSDPSASQDSSGSADNAAQSSPAAGEQGESAAEASAAQSGQASGGDSSPREGAEDHALRELRREWGNLPPRLREEISEGLNERFSPVYRRQTEAYYRRLAEEE